MKKQILLIVLPILLLVLTGCKERAFESSLDLPQFKERGELVVLTLYNSTSYFNYRGEQMGLQYELSNQFAQSLGMTVRIETARNVNELVRKLNDGEGDLIAYNLAVTNALADSLLYCGEEYITQQVLVQRKFGLKSNITHVTQLIGKQIFVRPGKSYDRMLHLNQELGGGIEIKLVPLDSLTTEDLITQVAQGRIDYMVCENDVANINKTYFENISVDFVVGFDQRASWAVRKGSPLLAEAANKWHLENLNSPRYKESNKRYFEVEKRTTHAVYLSVAQGKISLYDSYFKTYSAKVGWDWRLVASLSFTESGFDSTAVSWAGAEGIMQLMPSTAKSLGVPTHKRTNPEASIQAATSYLGIMDTQLAMVEDKKERVKFVLAAYNAGLGHVYDAMALAQKYDKNQYLWSDVEQFILLKSNEEYYNDPVCKYGYCRGLQTYQFVREITQRFEMYKEKIKF